MATALSRKLEASMDSRLARISRRNVLLRTELARRNGQPSPVPRLSPADRQQMQLLRRRRSFVVLVAEDRCSGELLGSATVSLAQPEAALPPPFPTSAPRRVYVSNIAVLQQYRRQGVASALLQQSERQARLWRNDSLWLHCEAANTAALKVCCVCACVCACMHTACVCSSVLSACFFQNFHPLKNEVACASYVPWYGQNALPDTVQHSASSSTLSSRSCIEAWGTWRLQGIRPSPRGAACSCAKTCLPAALAA